MTDQQELANLLSSHTVSPQTIAAALTFPYPPHPLTLECVWHSLSWPRSALLPHNHVTSDLHLNVTFLMGHPSPATLSVSDILHTSRPQVHFFFLLPFGQKS